MRFLLLALALSLPAHADVFDEMNLRSEIRREVESSVGWKVRALETRIEALEKKVKAL